MTYFNDRRMWGHRTLGIWIFLGEVDLFIFDMFSLCSAQNKEIT